MAAASNWRRADKRVGATSAYIHKYINMRTHIHISNSLETAMGGVDKCCKQNAKE